MAVPLAGRKSRPELVLPAVAMPGIFSIQWDMPLDSWFYAGHASDADGNEY